MKKSSTFLAVAGFLLIIALILQSSVKANRLVVLVFAIGAFVMLVISRVYKDKEKRESNSKSAGTNNMQASSISTKNTVQSSVSVAPKKQSDNTVHSAQYQRDLSYIKYIISNNSSVQPDEAMGFLLVVDVYDKTKDKQKTLEAFDAFITPITTGNLMHATMVCGFFCGLLGKNISLSDQETTMLSEKYSEMIKEQITKRGGIFN